MKNCAMKNNFILFVTTSLFTNQMHHKCMATTFFHIEFEIISYDYNQLYSCLRHLIIDLLL
jgi:hypothetical protein